jgi:outer membrane protein OmpA-like peptidoglycan-associated protein
MFINKFKQYFELFSPAVKDKALGGVLLKEEKLDFRSRNLLQYLKLGGLGLFLSLQLMACSFVSQNGVHILGGARIDPFLTREIDHYSFSQEENLPCCYFDFNQSHLTDNTKVDLQNLLNYLKENPHTQVVLAGHTDIRGRHTQNKILAKKRAQSVKAFLIQNGIKAARIRIVSYGRTKPLTNGLNESDHAQNRRVEFIYQT